MSSHLSSIQSSANHHSMAISRSLHLYLPPLALRPASGPQQAMPLRTTDFPGRTNSPAAPPGHYAHLRRPTT